MSPAGRYSGNALYALTVALLIQTRPIYKDSTGEPDSLRASAGDSDVQLHRRVLGSPRRGKYHTLLLK